MTDAPLVIFGDQPPDYYSPDAMARRFIEGYSSPHTRKALRADLTDRGREGTMSFFDWCAAVGIAPLALARRHAPAWARYLAELQLSPASQQRKITTVRCFYRHVVDVEQQLEVNPFPERNRSLHLAPVPKESQTRALSIDEWVAMRNAAERAGAWRDTAILVTLFYQGLRSQELCSLNQESFSWDKGESVVTIDGKGGKRRVILVARPVSDAIEHMLKTRDHGRDVVAHDGRTRQRPLFLDRNGRRMDTRQVAFVVRHWAEKGGVRGKVTPHCFRHTCTTLMLEDEIPLREVQRFMGHSTAAVTERYDARREQLSNSPVRKLTETVERRTREAVRD